MMRREGINKGPTTLVAEVKEREDATMFSQFSLSPDYVLVAQISVTKEPTKLSF
jgi:hypothetical protein